LRIALFYHSLLSDWNNGNAHFLRGIVSELQSRGHDVAVWEPRDAWSVRNLVAEHGEEALLAFQRAYPSLRVNRYELATLDLNSALDGVDLVIVHEWNEHELVRRIGAHRAASGEYRLLFHDTHHRIVTDSASMAAYDLSHYDGVLAFGRIIRDLYLDQQRVRRAWTWHEAADTRVFRPLPAPGAEGDLVWIGNWGDEERTEELHEFLLAPVRKLGLKARVYGVRYPAEAIRALETAGIEYGGWLPNFRAPEVFGQFQVTVHVPRRPYVRSLPGIPTIRPFEAMACGIPLVSAPWLDLEGLFTPGKDYLVARDGREMQRQLSALLGDADLRRRLAEHAHETILKRHTCKQRVDELLNIHAELTTPLRARRLEAAASARVKAVPLPVAAVTTRLIDG
jgi:spore maturation protein CgeB